MFYLKICIRSSVKNTIIIVLTVWKRNNLLMQLNLINSQTIIHYFNVLVVIFQNANHSSIKNIVCEYNRSYPHLNMKYIQTEYETGYYGRFLVPLMFSNNDASYFIICDDDILFGSEYLANMIRIVDEGSLATRNGRYIDSNNIEISTDKFVKGFVTWEKDLEYDFGGHMWAGKIEWLKLAWTHPTPTIVNCEDLWISVVLKIFYHITTKVPKCPYPTNSYYYPTMCACSDKSARKHVTASLGEKLVSTDSRAYALKRIKSFYNFKGILETNISLYEETKLSKIYHKNKIFKTNGVMNERCLYYI